MYPSTEAKKPVLVLGVGNIIQTDDGVGVYAVERLREYALAPEVELVDGGIAGIDLLSIIDGRSRMIVIDAVDAGLEPGTLLRFTPEDMADNLVPAQSLHQVGLLETLQMAALLGRAPEHTVIFGVQPGEVDWGLSLTKEIEGKLDLLLEHVIEEIGRQVELCREEGICSDKTGGSCERE
ncbi:hydrogenase maturation protease [bacterium]|nr:hydrogenase maturation protease [bacterium]